MARPVRALVSERCVVALGVAEGFKRRHLNAVVRHAVVRLIAAVPDIRAGRGKEALGVINALHRIEVSKRYKLFTATAATQPVTLRRILFLICSCRRAMDRNGPIVQNPWRARAL